MLKERLFRFHWIGGKTEESKGYGIVNAFTRLGYGQGAMKALDYYEEIQEGEKNVSNHGST